MNSLPEIDTITKRATYQTWRDMMGRCYNPNKHAYERYGGRGIAVDAEWHDVNYFRLWALSNGFQKGLQIDRIDNSKGYSSSNCRFVTATVNNRNRRNVPLITAFGETKTFSEWAQDVRCAVSYAALLWRYKNTSISDMETLISMPLELNGSRLDGRIKAKKKSSRYIEAFGETKTAMEWMSDSRCTVKYECLLSRINKGVPTELAMDAVYNVRASKNTIGVGVGTT